MKRFIKKAVFLPRFCLECKKLTQAKVEGPWVECDSQCGVADWSLYEDIPWVYQQYIMCYVEDLKEMYEVNLWPCEGVDYWLSLSDFFGRPKQLKKTKSCPTKDEIYAAKARFLWPWGGTMALKWPKAGKPFQFELFNISINENSLHFRYVKAIAF